MSPAVPDVKGHRYARPAETLINAARSWAGEAERRERERPEETEGWRVRQRDGERGMERGRDETDMGQRETHGERQTDVETDMETE